MIIKYLTKTKGRLDFRGKKSAKYIILKAT